jgi:hypothetical protein
MTNKQKNLNKLNPNPECSKAPICCDVPMELKCCTQLGYSLFFQCKKCGGWLCQ